MTYKQTKKFIDEMITSQQMIAKINSEHRMMENKMYYRELSKAFNLGFMMAELLMFIIVMIIIRMYIFSIGYI